MKNIIFFLSFVTLAQAAEQSLPKLNVDPKAITTSGVSSGAYMAVQMHVAHSNLISGAASVSGGVYWCAKGSSMTAQIDCMGLPSGDKADEHLKKAQEYEKTGVIDPLANIKDHKVFIFSSSGDNVIKQKNSDRLENFYKALMPAQNIVHRKHTQAAHGFPTDKYGNACNQGKSPWLLNCNLDLAGDILSAFYGTLQPKTTAKPENLKTFSQSAYNPTVNLLYPSGWIYIPTYCQQGGQCLLHVALHGCQMNPDFIQDQFVKHAGYNEWAESNNIIILYPQTSKPANNPQACWDWFGITNADYVTKKGLQVEALRQMIQAVMN